MVSIHAVFNMYFDMSSSPWPIDLGRLAGSSASTSAWIKASYPIELQHPIMISKTPFRWVSNDFEREWSVAYAIDQGTEALRESCDMGQLCLYS